VCVLACLRECVYGCGCTGAGVCLHTCSLNYPACNASLYCHLRPLWLHHIFRHYLISGTIFEKKYIQHIRCILIFCTTLIWNISILKRIHLHVKCPLFFPDLNEIWIFSTDFRNKLKYLVSLKSVHWELSCSMWTGIIKLTVALLNFANAPKNE
jgi:hypothetical protein